jgi:hypothetical protein
VGFITQCRLYHELTGDNTFLEIETAMRDWLLGCNPWGTSMIVGYPDGRIPLKTLILLLPFAWIRLQVDWLTVLFTLRFLIVLSDLFGQ